ncbi:hypothetical protein HK100_005468 [Physocladia obscura]|uniref:DNA (cytosine-5-)-methyltransferase n=1 Tax=Physocladia obscura TaxID=109957 RepID=A0AAD5X833_9FUNG|nr:hypothetical protein HK100_005468 [Physocladia obscura]
MLAVHVSSLAAVSIDELFSSKEYLSEISTQNIPPKIAEIKHFLCSKLISNTIQWIPNLRVRSKLCVFLGGKVDDSAYKPIPEKVVHFSRNDVKFRFVELFAGIGGFRVALDALGGQCVFASEINDAARKTYIANFGKEVSVDNKNERRPVLVGDITEIEAAEIPDHDILTAGFPCQSFCKVGDLTALNGIRGELFFDIIRILKTKKPKSFILENVENLVTMESGSVFSRISESLTRNAGYYIHHAVIDAVSYTPQTRARVYIVGFLLAADSARFEFPVPPTARPILRSILDSTSSSSLILNLRQMEKLQASYTFGKNPMWRIADVNGAARTLMGSYKSGFSMYSEFVRISASIDGTEERKPKRVKGREDDGVINSNDKNEDEEFVLRFYSVRECAKIMGFPDSYRFDGKAPGVFYHQLGNAVVPPVIENIGKQVLKALKI